MTTKTNMLRDAIKFALAVGATAAVGTGVAFAQDAAPAPAEQEATTLDRIQVTGSRISRTDIETSQPVFTLSREDITAQGLTSVGDVIQNITSSGSTLNSTYNNGGNGETRISLRNLGSNRTLVLVNGRRWVGGTGLGGAIDLNTIPTAAVERIEVLKDGASAIYGSDAIAGVVNVILRQNFDGAEANAYIGQYDQGDGQRSAVDFTVGSSGDRWSAMFGVGYVEEEPVMAGDRAISAVPVFGASPGFGGSFGTPNGNYAIIDPVTGEWQNPDGEYGVFVADPSDPRGWRPYTGIADNFNFAPDNYLITPQERTSLFANGSVDITDNVRFIATAQYNERRSEQLLAASPIFQFGGPGISANSIYNPYGRTVNAIARRFNEGGFRVFRQDVNTFAFNGVFEGSFEVGERFFDWEAGMFYGRNDEADITTGLVQLSRFNQAIGPSFREADGTPRCGTPTAPIANCVPLDLLSGAGTITQEMADGVTFVAQDQFGYEQKTHYANIGGELFDLPGGPLAFSFGVEQREESGFDQPDALINSGDTSGNARTATAGGYSVDEAYLELSIPVLADLPFAQLLDFSVATRYSDYSTFGDTLNSKFGFRWKPIDDLLIRGNWAEGFRAPSINELFSGQADSFPNLTDLCAGAVQGQPRPPAEIPAGCAGIPQYNQPNTQIRITVGGNPSLQPETAVSKTLGLVYSPSFVEGLDLSLDWWNIRLENTVSFISATEILNDCYVLQLPEACSLVTRNPDGSIADLLSSGINRDSRETEGYDLTVGYRLPENNWGKFSFVWDTTYMTLNEFNDDGDNLVGEYASRDNNWRIRSNLATRWEQGDFGATWNVRYFSGQDEPCSVASSQRAALCSDPGRFTNNPVTGLPQPSPENYIPSVTYNDASVYWKAPWNARITLGANNILDRDPPRSVDTFANSFDPQYEIPGRFYYMRYAQSF
ncbi:MAG: TonB-dependent receptor [Pseudomonadota bacterium]|nr:TonB-dependent receptor [Pseudomonadota bacterium]